METYTSEYMEMMVDDTCKIIEKDYIETLSTSGVSALKANVLTNEVEFWKWMDRNFEKSEIFRDKETMLKYIEQKSTKEQWFSKQIQGKGYEWDWMSDQRGKLSNLFKKFDAGDVSNRVGSDVTEIDLISGQTQEYQMKAYTSGNNPSLKNTAKDNIVVTNAEKIDGVNKQGYKSQSYKTTEEIIYDRDTRVGNVKDGTVNTSYNLKNIGSVAGKAALMGCIIGMSVETIKLYGQWKKESISTKEYLTEITKTGGEQIITGGASAAIMVPISSTITVAGLSTLFTFPIGIVVGGSIEHIIAPAFGRGMYKKQFDKAIYYKNVNEAYYDLVYAMQMAQDNYYNFLLNMKKQTIAYEQSKQANEALNKELDDLFNRIKE